MSSTARRLLARPVDRGRAIGATLQADPAAAVGAAPVFRHRPAQRLAARTGSATLARAGQRVDVVGAVLSLVIVAILAYIGLDVIGEVEQTTGFDTSADPSNRTTFENASADLSGGVEGAFSLMGVVFLVILLAVIIGLFLGLRR